MAGGTKTKNYYGVGVGRGGPRVYRTWSDCQAAVNGFPNSRYRGFMTLDEAEAWVNGWASTSNPPRSSAHQESLSSVPNVYFVDPNPEYSFDGAEADYIPLPSSPIKFLPSPARKPRQSPISKDMNAVFFECDTDDQSNSQIKFTDISALPGPPLSRQQLQIVERVKKGESIFFTGSAGTGKSVLLRAIINTLGGPSNHLAVTASTGIAAVNIGGTTLHSFAGIGLGKESVVKLVKKIEDQKTTRERWRHTKTLLIDEVSMIDGSLFDKLECIARKIRNNTSPFGGIQLIICGDFNQLPPVPDIHDGVQVPIIFAFDARSWNECIGTPIVLNKVFRQSDQTFIQMLNDMRFGRLDAKSEKRFAALCRPVVYTDGIEPTELFPLRREVATANANRLASLPGPSHTYQALDVSGRDIRGNPITPQQAEKLLERLVAVKQITLKVGAQVMLIKNLVQGSLVNGSLGKVVAFKTVAEARKDMTDIAKVDTAQDAKNKAKEVLSRDHPLNRVNSDPGDKMLDEKSMNKISGERRVWPVVHFTNGREILCIPVEFSVQNIWGEDEVKRDQVPLILSWALSVHKSQGQTIERVKVNLARTFEKGQAYVALSRATNMDTLQVLNFDRSKVMAHPRVLQWHANLTQKLDEEEEQAIIREMDDEEALKAFFENDMS